MAKQKRSHSTHHKRILLEVLIIIATVPIFRGIWELLDIVVGKEFRGVVFSVLIGIAAIWLLMHYSHHLRID
ncbi:MAG: hypothetical protein HYT16_03295 [DPANN group archaeon]|nr:hypothetical protein [DPANN group archaeon]